MADARSEAGPSRFPANEHSQIKRVIAVMSGKGGVGKSSVTSLLASGLQRRGNQIGILDADITGPSIPKLFGLQGQPEATAQGLQPAITSTGLKAMSINLLLGEETTPVIWRAPLLSNAIQQFWTFTAWGELDYLLVDLPPGTGDIPLTVMQSLPLDGIVMVMAPQELTVLIVKKAIVMAEKMSIPVLGLVENMSYVLCPRCDERIFVFGQNKGEKVGQELEIPLLASLPIDPKLAQLADAGQVEDYQSDAVKELVDNFLEQVRT